MISIVIPVKDDAVPLSRLLSKLSPMASADGLEVIVVDGDSSDDSAAVAQRAGALVLHGRPGRGSQLAAGCRQARGDWIWMLHADSQVPQAALTYVQSRTSAGWGRFDVRFDEPLSGLTIVARMMNLRSRWTGICTGDQGIFVQRDLLSRVGGVPDQPLMEDIELCRRLKRLCRPSCPDIQLVTAARRWRQRGVLQTILEMWNFRLRYWWGVDPHDLAREYYD
jgi:rSAM/selenodomain-associated transferase 2